MLSHSKRILKVTFALGLSLATLVACSSKEEPPKAEKETTDPNDAGTTADAGPSAKEGCLKLAEARCDRLERCSPYHLRTTYGEFENCEARAKLQCDGFDAPGTAMTYADVLQCASDVANAPCEDFLRGTLPASCDKPGTLDREMPCVADHQCKTGACGTHGRACGTCTMVSRNGEECVRANCAKGLVCLSGMCAKLGKSGASCDDARLPCSPGLACVRGKCAEPIRNEDTPCEPDSSACDVSAGLYCDREVKTCKSVTLAAVEEACGYLNRIYVACDSGALCVSGMCKAAAKDGEACVADSQCAAPARCLEKKCVVPGTSTCR